MKVFLEIIKSQTEEEIERGVPRQEIRQEVTGKSDDEIKSLRDQLVSLLGWTDYKSYKHICYHDEDPSKPCERVEI